MPRIYYQRVLCSDLSRRRKYLGVLLGHFWKRWSREYITVLRKRNRRQSTPEKIIPVTVGDTVTVFEENLPRSQWRLGRVDTRLMPGAKSRKPIGIKGPIQRLFPLKVPVVISNFRMSRDRTEPGHQQDVLLLKMLIC